SLDGIATGPEGTRILSMLLNERVVQHKLTPNEGSVLDAVCRITTRPRGIGLSEASCTSSPNRSASAIKGWRIHATCRETSSALSELYYLAKNGVYVSGKETYTRELEGYYARFGFTRSLAFVIFIGIYLCCVAYVAYNVVKMLRDYGVVRDTAALISS